MFIILLNENQTVIDSTEMYGDSTAVDSVVVYEVPDIIDFGSESTGMIDRALLTHYEITPRPHDVSLADALFLTPFMLYLYGDGIFNSISQNGHDPRKTAIFLNYHRLDNPLFGYFNLSIVPIKFFERILMDLDVTDPEYNNINLISKINRYDRPFSYINYTTGSFRTSIYNIDFTRPITNDFGLYLSGLYWSTPGYRDSADWKISSLYTNLYYNQFIPMRVDILYSSSDYGIVGSSLDTLYGHEKTQFIDASFVCEYKNHKMAVYYNQNKTEYIDAFSSIPLDNRIRNYGLSTMSHHNFKNIEVFYSLTGSMSRIESDPYGSYSENSLELWTKVNMAYKNLILSASDRGELKNTDNFFYTPRITIGMNIFDSTYVAATISRGFRAPSISEIYSPDVSSQYYKMKGNTDLRTEYYWRQELGIKRKNLTVTFYKIDFTDLIALQPDTDAYYTAENIPSWQTMGIENYLKIPLYFNNQPENKAGWEISTGFGSNYLFKGDTLPFIPKYTSSIFIACERETERFGLGLLAQGRFVGIRRDIRGQEISPFKIFSLAGTIRFITLSCTIKIDNILNEDYAYIPHFPMAPRNFKLSIKWEFWD